MMKDDMTMECAKKLCAQSWISPHQMFGHFQNAKCTRPTWLHPGVLERNQLVGSADVQGLAEGGEPSGCGLGSVELFC
eukprot:5413343-Ditylum_brightwellii.AAC.1